MADAATVTTFTKGCSATANSSSKVMFPVFMGASIFPPLDTAFALNSRTRFLPPYLKARQGYGRASHGKDRDVTVL
ncbi:conserved hypothetical protein [Ricinus communis]|uniref:Uncharacterized protein n=1 Tax=Ricinus communis TaxID=3988 RepID=B9RML5_RICCO|nr:conserved hypothetical protein [Ricinus communis]